MTKIPVWMDCDTGTDDAVAIMLAHSLPELDLLGISAVSGNTCQNNAFYNTHRICALMGADYDVYRGAERPLIRSAEYATAFHGENGLGDVELPLPENPVIHEEKAWDALYACAKEHPGQLRLVATGPLTNVATAFVKYPELPSLLHSVLIMGGAACYGNVSPCAEFNIYADPHSADIVFRCGAKIFMFGLDVTLKEYFTQQDLDDFAASGTKTGLFVSQCLKRAMINLNRIGLPGVSMHDSCPVMYLVHPEMFCMEEAGVAVETRGTITNGKTVTDLFSDRQFPFRNALVGLDVDKDSFISVLIKQVISIG